MLLQECLSQLAVLRYAYTIPLIETHVQSPHMSNVYRIALARLSRHRAGVGLVHDYRITDAMP